MKISYAIIREPNKSKGRVGKMFERINGGRTATRYLRVKNWAHFARVLLTGPSIKNSYSFSALVNSKRGILAKIRKPQNEIGRKRKRSGIPKENKNNHPYFMDWKLDDEIRLLQQL